jgi:hypothetical protein
LAKKPINEILSLPVESSKTEKEKNAENGDNYMDDDLLDDEDDFDVLVNVVLILPIEYDVPSEVTDEEDDFEGSEMANHKPVCYYVMGNGCVEEQQAVFEKPHEGMKNHLKPLFTRAKVNNVGVNKVLIYGGAVVNLMPHSLLRKIDKFNTDLHTHNIVLSNYGCHSGRCLCWKYCEANLVPSCAFEGKLQFALGQGMDPWSGSCAINSTSEWKILRLIKEYTCLRLTISQNKPLTKIWQ